jgi:PGF-pre-PGF domain-containing protein
MINKSPSFTAIIYRRSGLHSVRLFMGLLLFILLFVGDATAMIWLNETPDSIGDVGEFTSLGFTSDGNPGISYYDVTNHDLKYAEKNGNNWTCIIVDSAGDVGQYSSLALDNAGNPHISYFDSTNADLKYAYRNGSTWTIEIVDSAGSIGYYTSIALDSTNNSRISYFDGTNGHLKYAHKSSLVWFNETVDSSGSVGQYSSLALDSFGNPAISYYDSANGDLKYTEKTGISWTSVTVDSGGMVGWYTTLRFDSVGMPRISYFDATNRTLKYAERTGGSWTTTTVIPHEGCGTFNSLALDRYGNPFISYYNSATEDLGFVSRIGTHWIDETIDQAGSVGWYTSIALDDSDNPSISYYDSTNDNLKFIRGFSQVIPDFSALPVSGNIPLTVIFTDTSTGSPTSWVWEFGDGETASVQNPTHSYPAAGNYSVNLTAGNPGGSAKISRIDYIAVYVADTPTSTQTPIHTSSHTLEPTQIIVQSDSDSNYKPGSVAHVALGREDDAGQTVTFDFTKDIDPEVAFGVAQVQIIPEKKTGDIEMIVRNENPGDALRIIDKPVAGYIEITPVGINPSMVDQGIIRFVVPVTWLKNQDVNPEDIVLMRYSDGLWMNLPTEYNYQSGNMLHFTSVTSGFSCFVVTIRTQPEPLTEMPLTSSEKELLSNSETSPSDHQPKTMMQEDQNHFIPQEGYGFETIPITPEQSVASKNSNGDIGVPMVILTGIGIAGIMVVVFLLRRWYIRRQNPNLFR